MSEDQKSGYCCVHAAMAAAAEERRSHEPPVITPAEYLALNRRASQRHEYVDGIAYPKEYPPRSFDHRLPVHPETPAHTRALDFLWHDARVEREINGERWRVLLTDARDWDCDLDAVRSAGMDLAGIVAQFDAWELRVRRLWENSGDGTP